jgi:hypothetical protein
MRLVALCVLILSTAACVARAPKRPTQGEAARSSPLPPTNDRTAAELIGPSSQAGPDEPGPAPAGTIWVNGYWHWSGVRWVWVAGHWERPKPHFAWH